MGHVDHGKTSLLDAIRHTKVAAGESVSVSRDCDELQAIVVNDADLKVLGGVGPEHGSSKHDK